MIDIKAAAKLAGDQFAQPGLAVSLTMSTLTAVVSAQQGPIKCCCHGHLILAKIGHPGIQAARSTHRQVNIVDVRGRVTKYPENRASNSVGQIILLPQHSTCQNEVKVNMTKDFNTGLDS